MCRLRSGSTSTPWWSTTRARSSIILWASPVTKGELLLWFQLDMSANSSISEKIPQGKKAITIQVNNVTGVDGMLRPKMVIDLYGTYRLTPKGSARGENESLQAIKLLENVTIIAAGDSTASDTAVEQRSGRAGYQTVTILVDTKDVEREDSGAGNVHVHGRQIVLHFAL